MRWPLVSRHRLDAAEGRASVLQFDLESRREEVRELGVCTRSAEERYLDALMKLSSAETARTMLADRVAELDRQLEAAAADKERLQDIVEAQALNLRTEAPKPAPPPAEVRSVTGFEVVQRAEKHRAAHPQRAARPFGVRPVVTPPPGESTPGSGGQS